MSSSIDSPTKQNESTLQKNEAKIIVLNNQAQLSPVTTIQESVITKSLISHTKLPITLKTTSTIPVSYISTVSPPQKNFIDLPYENPIKQSSSNTITVTPRIEQINTPKIPNMDTKSKEDMQSVNTLNKVSQQNKTTTITNPDLVLSGLPNRSTVIVRQQSSTLIPNVNNSKALTVQQLLDKIKSSKTESVSGQMNDSKFTPNSNVKLTPKSCSSQVFLKLNPAQNVSSITESVSGQMNDSKLTPNSNIKLTPKSCSSQVFLKLNPAQNISSIAGSQVISKVNSTFTHENVNQSLPMQKILVNLSPVQNVNSTRGLKVIPKENPVHNLKKIIPIQQNVLNISPQKEIKRHSALEPQLQITESTASFNPPPPSVTIDLTDDSVDIPEFQSQSNVNVNYNVNKIPIMNNIGTINSQHTVLSVGGRSYIVPLNANGKKVNVDALKRLLNKNSSQNEHSYNVEGKQTLLIKGLSSNLLSSNKIVLNSAPALDSVNTSIQNPQHSGSDKSQLMHFPLSKAQEGIIVASAPIPSLDVKSNTLKKPQSKQKPVALNIPLNKHQPSSSTKGKRISILSNKVQSLYANDASVKTTGVPLVIVNPESLDANKSLNLGNKQENDKQDKIKKMVSQSSLMIPPPSYNAIKLHTHMKKQQNISTNTTEKLKSKLSSKPKVLTTYVQTAQGAIPVNVVTPNLDDDDCDDEVCYSQQHDCVEDALSKENQMVYPDQICHSPGKNFFSESLTKKPDEYFSKKREEDMPTFDYLLESQMNPIQSDIRIDSVFSLANYKNYPEVQVVGDNSSDTDSVCSEDRELAENVRRHEMMVFDLNCCEWKSHCKSCFTVLERLSKEDVKAINSGETSAKCSNHCRKRHLNSLCQFGLLVCNNHPDVYVPLPIKKKRYKGVNVQNIKNSEVLVDESEVADKESEIDVKDSKVVYKTNKLQNINTDTNNLSETKSMGKKGKRQPKKVITKGTKSRPHAAKILYSEGTTKSGPELCTGNGVQLSTTSEKASSAIDLQQSVTVMPPTIFAPPASIFTSPSSVSSSISVFSQSLSASSSCNSASSISAFTKSTSASSPPFSSLSISDKLKVLQDQVETKRHSMHNLKEFRLKLKEKKKSKKRLKSALKLKFKSFKESDVNKKTKKSISSIKVKRQTFRSKPYHGKQVISRGTKSRPQAAKTIYSEGFIENDECLINPVAAHPSFSQNIQTENSEKLTLTPLESSLQSNSENSNLNQVSSLNESIMTPSSSISQTPSFENAEITQKTNKVKKSLGSLNANFENSNMNLSNSTKKLSALNSKPICKSRKNSKMNISISTKTIAALNSKPKSQSKNSVQMFKLNNNSVPNELTSKRIQSALNSLSLHLAKSGKKVNVNAGAFLLNIGGKPVLIRNKMHDQKNIEASKVKNSKIATNDSKVLTQNPNLLLGSKCFSQTSVTKAVSTTNTDVLNFNNNKTVTITTSNHQKITTLSGNSIINSGAQNTNKPMTSYIRHILESNDKIKTTAHNLESTDKTKAPIPGTSKCESLLGNVSKEIPYLQNNIPILNTEGKVLMSLCTISNTQLQETALNAVKATPIVESAISNQILKPSSVIPPEVSSRLNTLPAINTVTASNCAKTIQQRTGNTTITDIKSLSSIQLSSTLLPQRKASYTISEADRIEKWLEKKYPLPPGVGIKSEPEPEKETDFSGYHVDCEFSVTTNRQNFDDQQDSGLNSSVQSVLNDDPPPLIEESPVSDNLAVTKSEMHDSDEEMPPLLQPMFYSSSSSTTILTDSSSSPISATCEKPIQSESISDIVRNTSHTINSVSDNSCDSTMAIRPNKPVFQNSKIQHLKDLLEKRKREIEKLNEIDDEDEDLVV